MDVNVMDYAPLKASGTAGSISGSTITQSGAFSGVSDGDTLRILSGDQVGSFLIASHTSNTATVVGASWTSESSLEWKVNATLTLTHRAGSESHLVASGMAIISSSPYTLLQTGGFTSIEDGMELQVEVDGTSYYYPIASHDDDSLTVDDLIPPSSETVDRPWWVRTTRGALQPGEGYEVDTLFSPGSFAGVQVGDTLWLQSGLDMGTHTISQVGTDFVRVASIDWDPLNNVRWKITAWAPYDCTAVFQAAIDAASVDGGKVYVPSGYYHFAGSLEVKPNTVLTGMWNLSPQWSEESWMEGVAQGPVLCPTDGLQDEEYGVPFITLDGNGRNAGVEGLSIYYPLQGIVDGAGTSSAGLASYPWCISMESESGNLGGVLRVQNVQLVNPYKGILIDLEGGSGHVSGVSGCPLLNGIHIERATDTTYIEKIAFHPENWLGSFVDAFSNDVRTRMLGFMTAFQVKDAYRVLFSGVSVYMAGIGMRFTTDAYPSSLVPIVDGTNIVIDMANECITANSGTLSFANTSLHTTVREGHERIVNTPTVYSPYAKCVKASGYAYMSFVGGNMAASRYGVHWTSDGCLNVSGVSIASLAAGSEGFSYGIYAEAGDVRVHGNAFPPGATGFSELVRITSGAAKGIVYGNDYHASSIGLNEAADRELVDDGDFIVHGSVTGDGDMTVDGNITATYGNIIADNGNISATNGNLVAGHDINAGGNISALGSITAKAGTGSGTFKAAGALFNVFGSATTSGTSQTALLSTTLPEDSLTTTGDKLRIVAGGSISGGGAGMGTWSIALKIGSTTVFSGSVVTTGISSTLTKWLATVDIWKNGSNAVICGQMVADTYNSNSGLTFSSASADYNSIAVDFTSNQTLQIFGQAPTNGSITHNIMSGEIYPTP